MDTQDLIKKKNELISELEKITSEINIELKNIDEQLIKPIKNRFENKYIYYEDRSSLLTKEYYLLVKNIEFRKNHIFMEGIGFYSSPNAIELILFLNINLSDQENIITLDQETFNERFDYFVKKMMKKFI